MKLNQEIYCIVLLFCTIQRRLFLLKAHFLKCKKFIVDLRKYYFVESGLYMEYLRTKENMCSLTINEYINLYWTVKVSLALSVISHES